MPPSTRADTLADDVAPEPTATVLEHAPFEDSPTVEDSSLDECIDPPTAKHDIRWLEDSFDKTPAPTQLWG
jgi:hypothetical protein